MNAITKENIRNVVDSSISVVFHRFNSHCIEANKNKVFCFFEGKDASYYSPRIKKYFSEQISFACNNKKNVLKLYAKIKFKKSLYQLAFFVDKDFDDPIENPDIYETPTYSIENFYCTRETLINILNDEYYLNNADPTYNSIIQLYESQLTDYLNKILLFNSWYYSLKKKKQKLNLESTNVSLDEKIPNSFLSLEILNIRSSYTMDCIRNKFDKALDVTDDEVQEAFNELSSKDLLQNLRGKYVITFLIKFIEFLMNDSKTTKIYIKENNNFITNKNIVLSHLSNYAITPICLENYIKSINKLSA